MATVRLAIAAATTATAAFVIVSRIGDVLLQNLRRGIRKLCPNVVNYRVVASAAAGKVLLAGIKPLNAFQS